MASDSSPSDADFVALLLKSRLELLDLSTRNRLLNAPRLSKYANALDIADEISREVYRLLVVESRSLSFKPGRESPLDGLPGESPGEDGDWATLPQPDDDEPVDERGVAARHTDSALQTRLSSHALQRRLLTLYYDSKTLLEEQGVNILYLAVGLLTWFDAPSSAIERYAPLVLIPVTLERSTASDRFRVRWSGEDPLPNLTLIAKMKSDFGLILPEFDFSDDFDFDLYVHSVRQATTAQPRWRVLPDDMLLGFFSFAKFLMYRDLDPANWPEDGNPVNHPSIRALLRDGFNSTIPLLHGDAQSAAIARLASDSFIMDADSSQSLAIEEVRRGANLVIQGPPGTGKSQTIANIIADAVRRGQRVLFVAEKLAALEVVKRRLDSVGLDACCLELHSNKANKRAVLAELKRTLDLGRPVPPGDASAIPALESARATLDRHCEQIGSSPAPGAGSIFESLGHLIAFQAAGLQNAGFELPAAPLWDAYFLRQQEALVSSLSDRIAQDGVPCHHPWYGVHRPSILPADRLSLLGAIGDAIRLINQWRSLASQLSSSLNLPCPTCLDGATAMLRLAAIVSDAPNLDRDHIAHASWADLHSLAALLGKGLRYRADLASLGPSLTEQAWTGSLTDTSHAIDAHGDSLFRWLFPSHRRAVRHIESLVHHAPPASRSERLQLLGRIRELRELRAFLDSSGHPGFDAFGRLWNRSDSDWDALTQLVQWASLAGDLAGPARLLLAHSPQIAHIRATFSQLQALSRELPPLLSSLTSDLHLDCAQALNAPSLSAVPFESLLQRFDQWLNAPELLSRWITFNALRLKAIQGGLAPLAEDLWTGRLPHDRALSAFRLALHSSIVKTGFASSSDLSAFDGAQHDSVLARYRRLDSATHFVARFQAAASHWEHIPKSASAVGPLGILRTEIEKRRKHLPIRQLVKHCGPAIQALKPVFMMSPLSIAQFLEPGAVRFDLVLFDEASQVQPVDALGAVARAHQLVVVGDDRQLPPTRFFSRLTSDGDLNEDEVGEGVRDIESILGLCRARGVPQSMLRWHYRSRHHSLIAVSNREFYHNSLFIVPSPWAESSTMGLRFNFIRDGIFDSGATATNVVEAKAVAAAVMRHARAFPDLSLGVATFSVKQKQAILDELELLRRRQPELESFFSDNPDEPFFVKNLENIQGDERDVVMISIGYAKNKSGYMAMRFGPLSADGGERRLNVLISRAKIRCEVFSSIVSDEIDLERGRGHGVAALKTFLCFAEKGILGVAQSTGRDHDSPFEEAVASAIQSRGFEVRKQVGLAGFFIDLAVVHPSQPGRYVLGIECDGATYHSTISTRDRDRLRQAVLEDHGWRIHRIWSIDWFQRPNQELDRLIDAIQNAISDAAADPAAPSQLGVSIDTAPLQRADPGASSPAPLSLPYVEACFPVPSHIPLHEVSTGEMLRVVTQIVQTEGPIHADEIVARVRQLWNLARAGSRIQAAVGKAIDSALAASLLRSNSGFISAPDTIVCPRDRSRVASATLRKPSMLPPAEIDAAILALIRAHHGAGTDELTIQVPRLLGYAAVSSQLRSLVEHQITQLQSAATIGINGGMWSISSPKP